MIIIKFISLALPITMFITIGQIHGTQQMIAAVFFMAISFAVSLTHWDTPERKEKAPLAIARESYRMGMIFLALFACLISIFPVGGVISLPLMLEHSSDTAQAILVLGSGATPAGDPNYSGLQRVTHGVNLLKAGKAPHLFISTGFSPIQLYSEAAWVASFTSMLDLPAASFTLLISPEIVTTAREAAYARKLFEQQGINDILLVTSGAHIYRSCATFRKVGFNIKPAPTHDSKSIYYSSDNYLGSFHAAAHEWIGLLYYWLRAKI